MVTQEAAIKQSFGKGDNVDENTFMQILEMDEEGDHEFSKGIVFDFFGQAENTFDEIRAALTKKELETLSKLGHFLKGSSATLGLVKVRDSCESIQNLGLGKDDNGEASGLDDAKLLEKIGTAFTRVEGDYGVAKTELTKFYELVEE